MRRWLSIVVGLLALFASPSAVRNFERLAPGALARATRVFCHGRTTLAAVGRADAEPFTL